MKTWVNDHGVKLDVLDYPFKVQRGMRPFNFNGKTFFICGAKKEVLIYSFPDKTLLFSGKITKNKNAQTVFESLIKKLSK